MQIQSIPAYCINLPQAQERWKAIQDRCLTFGISVKQWIASTPNQVEGNYVEYLSPLQRACTYSHIQLWKHALESGYDCIFVLEDDAKFRYDWIEEINKFLPTLPEDWDSVFLNISEEITPLHTWVPVRDQCLTAGYIIHRRGMEFLLNHFHAKYYASDWMTQILQRRGRSYSIFPWLIIQDGSPSCIQKDNSEDYKKVVRFLTDYNYPLANYI